MPKRSHNSSSNSPYKSKSSSRRQLGSRRKLSPQYGARTQGNDLNKIYISGFPGGFREQEVKQICQKYGKLIDVLVIDKKTYSFAFVQYQRLDQALEAIKKISGIQIKNKTIRCQIAKERPPRRNDQNSRNRAPRDGGKGKNCYKCGIEGHIARFCQNQEEKEKDHQYEKSNADKKDSRKQSRSKRARDHSKNSEKSFQKNRRKRSSSSSSESKPKRKRQSSDSRSIRKQKKKDNKRQKTPSSSRSNNKRKGRKHKRSRSAELRKGKKRHVSSSSSSD